MGSARRWILVAATIAAASPASAAGLDPLAFFTGRTRGNGKLKIVMKAPVPISVDSHGKPDGHGGIVLDQIIREAQSRCAAAAGSFVRPRQPRFREH